MNKYVCRTVTFDSESSWGDDVKIINERGFVNSRVARFPIFLQNIIRRWFQFWFACKMLLQTPKFSSIAVGRYGLWVPVLSKILRLKRNIVLTDVEWPKVKHGYLNRLAAQGSRYLCCFTTEEIRRYSLQYKIKIDKFKLVHAPFDERNLFKTKDGGYIFAGGYQSRDWDTLIAALKDTPYIVKIFTKEIIIPWNSNVSIEHSSSEEYYRAMANASCVVVPIKPEPMRITGMMTWTTAMAMGKTVIVTEPLGAPDYMVHELSGFVLNYADVESLRCCVEQVMSDKELRNRIGLEAKKRAWIQASPQVFRNKILDLLE
ncbi:MAG: glycosyltransferase [Desulforhopalus sp.]|nr:glycosyltransferase [Desulforhopalus sp.]